MREMRYGELSGPGIVVLDKGKKDNFYWVIVSYRSHPCAYIGLPKGHRYFEKTYSEEELYTIGCHGGITYAKDDLLFNPVDLDLWWIGWDYAHAGDYHWYPSDSGMSKMSDEYEKTQHKWTTEEMKKEVFNVIEQLKKVVK